MKRPTKRLTLADITESPAPPLDVNDDQQLRTFSRARLIQIANSENATASVQATKELWERAEPKAERKEAQLPASEQKRIADIYEAIFAGDYCEFCGRGTKTVTN